jgi:hypothetical protein
MQMILANALPGFRDLRAPLVAGYLWIVFAWLLVKPDFTHRPEHPLSGSLYDLGQQAGPFAVAVAIGTGAYLLGALSQEATSGFRRRLSVVLPWVRARFPRLPEITVGTRMSMTTSMASSGTLSISLSRTMPARLHQQLRRFEELPDELNQRYGQEFVGLLNEAFSEFVRELNLPATLLVGEKDQLFAEVDRLRAEGDLRLAVVPPLLAIMLLLANEDSLWWLLGLPAIGLLAVQGARRQADSRKVIQDAIDHGTIESAALNKFDAASGECLPRA